MQRLSIPCHFSLAEKDSPLENNDNKDTPEAVEHSAKALPQPKWHVSNELPQAK